METQTLTECTSSSTMMKLRREAEESKKIVHKTFKNLQTRFDKRFDLLFVPSAGADLVTPAQANVELKEALKVSKLESKNSSLKDCLKNKEEYNIQLQQIKKQLEDELFAVKCEGNILKVNYDKSERQYLSYIKKLEEERELSRVKSKRFRETFEEEMAALDRIHEEKLAEMSEKMKKESDFENEELRESVKKLTLTVKQLEEARKQKEDCQPEKTAQATQTKGELETAEMDINDLRQQLCQEQTANTAGKKLQTKLTAEVTSFQSKYEKAAQSVKSLYEHIGKLEEERRGFLMQLKECNQQTNAVSHPQQEWPQAEQQRLQQVLDKEIQSHNNKKSLVKRLEQENKRLKQSLQIQEQEPTNAYPKDKKGMWKHVNLLNDFQKKVAECKEKERIINSLHCQLQDRAVTKSAMDQEEVNITLQKLQEQLKNVEQEKDYYKVHLDGLRVEYKQTSDWLHHYVLETNQLKSHIQVLEERQCEESVMDQEEVNITLQKLKEQLKNEEQEKEYYKAHLDGLCGEHERTCEWLDHYVFENNELKSYIEMLEDCQWEESVMGQEEVKLQEQLKKEEQDKEYYKAPLDGLCGAV